MMSDQIPPMGKLGKRKAADRKVLIKSPPKKAKEPKDAEEESKEKVLESVN